jgi:oligopeptidase A
MKPIEEITMKNLKIYDFSTSPKEAEQQLTALLAEYRAFVETRLAQGSPYTWGNLVVPMEELDARFKEIWSPLGHRNAVAQTDELRSVYMRCVGLVSNFGVDMSQNKGLFDAYQEMADSAEFSGLLMEQQKTISNALRDFRLAGVHLPTEQKARYKEIAQRLSELQTSFENNLTDATNAWEKHVTDEIVLSGLPEAIKENARKKAEERGFEGYILTVDDGTAPKVFSFADNRALREEFFFVRSTRASEIGPHAGTYDNTPIYEEILALRHEEALLLGFNNYAELSLATKMAENTDEVMEFMNDLALHARTAALREYEELSAFAKERDGVETLDMWDVNYYIEQLKNKKFSFSAEELSRYFPLPQVLDGMFTVVNRLYSIRLKERQGMELWHPDAKFFELYSQDGELIGGVYMDFYARPKKRGGAWMDEAVISRTLFSGTIELPVGYLTCNFTRSSDGPSLLTHGEVETLFHEFGHELNHLLTRIKQASAVSGINGVEWDAVELPSQFMENFCWERESLDLFAKHHKTGDTIPEELFQKMHSARTFGEGLFTLRQVIMALFDFRLYKEYDPENSVSALALYDEVFANLSPLPRYEWNRFPNGFAHIFAGGYAAGYYSYHWALVLAVDAFFAFIREDGTIDWSMGEKFLDEILSRGGSRPAMENFVAFRGRKPSIEPLLKQNGFVK